MGFIKKLLTYYLIFITYYLIIIIIQKGGNMKKEDKTKYKENVQKYFQEKRERFLKSYPDFETLNRENSKALKEWSKEKELIENGTDKRKKQVNKMKKVYHKHANLSTAFKTIRRKYKH